MLTIPPQTFAPNTCCFLSAFSFKMLMMWKNVTNIKGRWVKGRKQKGSMKKRKNNFSSAKWWYTIRFLVCLFLAPQPTPQWARVSWFTRFLDHTQRRNPFGRTPLDEWSARNRDLNLTTHNTHNRQTSIPPVGFETTTPTGERLQTARPLGPAVYLFTYFGLFNDALICTD